MKNVHCTALDRAATSDLMWSSGGVFGEWPDVKPQLYRVEGHHEKRTIVCGGAGPLDGVGAD